MNKCKKIQKVACKFIKTLKKQITFENAVKFLQDRDYTVMYYSTPECYTLLQECQLVELSEKVNAITYSLDSANFVFINDNIAYDDMLCAIYHEIAHILLGHLSLNPYVQDERRNEMEAEALAYKIMNYKKSKKPVIITSIIAVVLSLACVVLFYPLPEEYLIDNNVTSEPAVVYKMERTTNVSSTKKSSTKTVLVTPSGKKFHKPSCKYVKGKDCTELSRSDAVEDYDPCSVCKP